MFAKVLPSNIGAKQDVSTIRVNLYINDLPKKFVFEGNTSENNYYRGFLSTMCRDVYLKGRPEEKSLQTGNILSELETDVKNT